MLDSGFSAEYGFGLGSVVNIITKSGANQLHRQVLGWWRPSGSEAKLSGFTPQTAAGGNDIANDTLYQGAASLSGPVWHAKRTHFFLSGQYTAQNRVSTVTSPVLRENFTGHFRSWLSFLRIDHQINTNNSLFLRSDTDSFYGTNPNGAVGGNSLPSVDRIFTVLDRGRVHVNLELRLLTCSITRIL